MNIIIKRNEDWLLSIFKNNFDVLELTDKKIKIYTDWDLYEAVIAYSKFAFSIFDDLSECVTLEGIITESELTKLSYLESANAILIKEKKHLYLLDQEGFFGNPGEFEATISINQYWVSYVLNTTMSKEFIKKEILYYLKDIRIKETMNNTR